VKKGEGASHERTRTFDWPPARGGKLRIAPVIVLLGLMGGKGGCRPIVRAAFHQKSSEFLYLSSIKKNEFLPTS
jgi:hypothetical protein